MKYFIFAFYDMAQLNFLCCFLFADKVQRQYLNFFLLHRPSFFIHQHIFLSHLSPLAITDLAFTVVKN